MPLYPCWAWGVWGAVKGERADEDVRDPRADEDVRAPGEGHGGLRFGLFVGWRCGRVGVAAPRTVAGLSFSEGRLEESPDTTGQRASRKRGTGFREGARTESATESKPPTRTEDQAGLPAEAPAKAGKGERVG